MEISVFFMLCLTACIALGILAIGLFTLFLIGLFISIRIVRRVLNGDSLTDILAEEI